jgi:DNA-binding CsgD family transcriptional regulator
VDAHALTRLDTEVRESLLERDTELLVTGEALRQAADGRGSVLAIEGPAGCGKSALMAVLGEQARERGFEVGTATGREPERDFTLGVVLQLLEDRVARAPDGEREALFSGAARQALPLFATGPLPAGEELRPAEAESVDAESEASFALLHGLYRLCVNLAVREPLFLAVDDAELADRESLRFLLYLAERARTIPIVLALIVGGARGRDWGLLEQIVRHPGAVRCPLRPLSRDATGRRVRQVWQPDAPDSVCHAVHAASSGNPWLIDELGAALGELGLDPRVAAVRVPELCPPAIATRALARARTLAPTGPALLEAAAVLGPRAELRQAARLAGVESDQASGVVDALADSGVLLRDQRLTFAQPVVEASIRAGLPLAERAALHLRAARMLADEEASPERVGLLLLQAERSGSGWVVDALAAAGAWALARGAPDEAVRYLSRALDEPPPPDRRARVMLDLGRAEATAGDPRGGSRLSEAIERVTEGPERARTALETAHTLLALGRHADARQVLERGLEAAEAPGGELAERLRVAEVAIARLYPGDRTCEPISPPRGDDTAADRAMLALAAFDSAVRGAPREEARELAVRALHRGALLDEETADGLSYYLASAALVLVEELSTAEVALTAAVEDAQSRGSVLGLASASYGRSVAIMARGRIVDAAADARHAVAAERQGWRIATAGARAVMAGSLFERGDLEAVARQVNAAELTGDMEQPTWVAWLATRARLRLVRGETEQALGDFRRCGDLLERAGVLNPAVIPWRSGVARACAVLGDRAEARRLAEHDLTLAERFGAPGTIGRALRGLAAVSGDDSGVEALEAAVETLDGSQAALERARARVDYGAALRRSGRRRDAREPLRRGADLAQRCGADMLTARAVREAKVAGARPRRTALKGVEALTARERQVAALAAQGLSNREIAEALYVTVKTVEWHLKHTYQKLEVDSRRKLRDVFERGAPASSSRHPPTGRQSITDRAAGVAPLRVSGPFGIVV